jgi:hypothetical protein
MGGRVVLYAGDCLDLLAALPEASVDAVVTDPPYGLGFMGRGWDQADNVAFRPATWAAVARTMKPGAHLVAFGGSRTFHRLAVAIEDAGFELRDTLMWLYGTGFPKSHAVLKPAFEPITLARRPLEGTVEANVLRHGVGGLNIDGCRVATDDTIKATRNVALGSSSGGVFGAADVPGVYEQKDGGRWPANVLLSYPEDQYELAPWATEDQRKEVYRWLSENA